MPIQPVRGVGNVGLVSDIPSILLPPESWSDCLNVRFDNGSVEKILGHEQMFSLNTVQPTFLQYWSRPVTPYYVYGTATALSRIDGAGNISNVTRTGANYSSSGRWQSTLYNGGYTVVLNNGVDTPQYITYGTAGAVQETMFQDLPNFPASTQAGVVRSAGYALIAGNITDTSGATTNFFPGRIIVSSQAAPGGVPSSWTVGTALLTTADEFDLSQTSPILEFVDLRGSVLVFTRDSIHSVVLATPRTPTRAQTLNLGKGILATGCAVEIDGEVFVVDADDIYVTGGTGAIKSVADEKVRDFFFNHLDITRAEETRVIRNLPQDEVWICYTSVSAPDARNDAALIWNYKQNTWTRRDLPGVTAVTFGPRAVGNAFAEASPHVVFSGYQNRASMTLSNRLHVADRTNRFNGDDFTAYVERQNFDMGSIDATKWNSTIYPLIDGTGSVTFRALGRNTFGEDINLVTDRNAYSGVFSIGNDYKLDTRVNGRFISFRFESSDSNSWRLAGYSLNVDANDRR